jgi:2-oxoglutarate ferredoxin oxidoreductase subunit alpha
VAVEGNATGQLARLLRQESGFRITDMVLRFDGLPITAAYILRGLESIL